MKEIKAQTSDDILRMILPISGIDSSRAVLSPREADALFSLWKNASNSKAKPSIPYDMDRLVVANLKQKGFIESNGPVFEFTQRGREAIKIYILTKEQNALQKKADK